MKNGTQKLGVDVGDSTGMIDLACKIQQSHLHRADEEIAHIMMETQASLDTQYNSYNCSVDKDAG